MRIRFRIGAGVCQDFAHLLLGVVRMRGLPARYVSGYLVPDGAAGLLTASQEEVIGGQASHAWVEVYSPGDGWIGFDPTLGKPVGLRHVRVAYGRDYGDVAPVRGVYKGHAGQRLSVDVRVRPALDDDGHEQINETAAPRPPARLHWNAPSSPPNSSNRSAHAFSVAFAVVVVDVTAVAVAFVEAASPSREGTLCHDFCNWIRGEKLPFAQASTSR